jgi:hypothetical protein
MVFVVHPMTGVHKVPAEWLEPMAASGFRKATRREIAQWHEERGLDPPRSRPGRSRPRPAN